MTTNHNDDEIIITETPRVLEIRGSGCIIRSPDLSDILYMAHRLEIRDITLGTLGWIPEWILEVYMENCQLLPTTAEPGNKLQNTFTNLPQNVIQLTCKGCSIPERCYQQLAHNRLIRLELINQGLAKLPESIFDFAPNLLFLNLNSNQLTEPSIWPAKIRGLRLSNNKLVDLAHLGQLPPYLEDLDLSFNRFSEIPTCELSPHIRKLNMSRNELQWLPENQTEYPPNLRDLNIAGNCGLDDLTDAVLPDMLTTLNAAECEISRLPHDLDCYCLTNMDLSDNNISSLDELPFDKVININYVGNPCWVPSVASSPVPLDNVFESINTDSCDTNNNDLSEQESCANSVFSSGCSSPINKLEANRDLMLDSMMDYKEAIRKSSSQEELEKINCQFPKQTNNNLAYPANDPLIQAIDFVVASGVKRVGSFLNAMSDILTPSNDDTELDDNQDSVYSSPSQKSNNSVAGQVLDDIDYYGIFGSFE